jgi:glycosyltransferase involved in cell wall biosynthesis
MKKHKILLLSDDMRCASGVGLQSRTLIEGLVKTGKYSVRQLGGAVKHPNYDVQMIHPDVVVKPIDGFGTPALLRQLLITEKPDVLLLFTDPRQFVWVWQMEDEVNQVCPIAYNHVWDNDPYPDYNTIFYESTDLINCISKKTYDLVSSKFPDKTNYIPHSFPPAWAFNISQEEIDGIRAQTLGPHKDDFIFLWVNRNAHRKMPSDVIHSFKMFLELLQEREGHKDALLLMHTNPKDPEGPDLNVVAETLGVSNRVVFSVGHVDIAEMNKVYNIADCVVNLSRAEGFGLGIQHAITLGKPVVALKTGGMTEQVIDARNGNVHGVALDPVERYLVGSQMTPYIYDDHFSKKEAAEAMYKVFKFTPEEREKISNEAKDHVAFQFNYDKMISEWDRTLEELIQKWRAGKGEKNWGVVHFNPPSDAAGASFKVKSPKVKG